MDGKMLHFGMMAMKRLLLLGICGLLVGCHTALAGSERPNIIVILADDLGYSDLGCYGGEVNTPHIDALASGGVRFTQMYNSARCCPTRASLMTGLYPSQAGIGDFTSDHPNEKRGPGYIGRLNDSCVTIAEALGREGYGCYYVGKWHLNQKTGPIQRGFHEFYGYTRNHSQDQYDPQKYERLPYGRRQEIHPPEGEFYATDVFNEYAQEFVRQGQASDKPWFLFLAHSSPHFPVQAPAERADKHEKTYLRGWDVLRQERFQRMKELGLVDGDRWVLTERSLVPVDREDIANGYSGRANPAWDTLSKDRRHDLARRMAVYAAMVESVDQGVGRIVDQLQRSGDLDNTLILFLSDNGACYEWGPFGFDGQSRQGTTTLRTGEELREIGGPGTHQSYGSAWANLCNTPFRLYKHFTHEGGISTPFIAHWPSGFGSHSEWVRDPVHVIDVLPTLLSAARAEYPVQRKDEPVPPLEGVDLLPAMRGKDIPDRILGFDHQAAHAFRDGDWKLVWSKRMPQEIQWELYNLSQDRCELNDLASTYPHRVDKMVEQWYEWARRVGVIWNEGGESYGNQLSPRISNCALVIDVEVLAEHPEGVVISHGGNQYGYSLHFVDGRPVFTVRMNGIASHLSLEERCVGEVSLCAKLDLDTFSLCVNNGQIVSRVSPGLLPMEPLDEFMLGVDDRTTVGEYTAPNKFNGKIIRYEVTATPSGSVESAGMHEARR